MMLVAQLVLYDGSRTLQGKLCYVMVGSKTPEGDAVHHHTAGYQLTSESYQNECPGKPDHVGGNPTHDQRLGPGLRSIPSQAMPRTGGPAPRVKKQQ